MHSFGKIRELEIHWGRVSISNSCSSSIYSLYMHITNCSGHTCNVEFAKQVTSSFGFDSPFLSKNQEELLQNFD